MEVGARACVRACVSLSSYPVSLSRSPSDARTPEPTDRLRVISLSPLTRTQIFIGVRPSRCTVWHQQSCATRTGPCGDPGDLEKMSRFIYLFLFISPPCKPPPVPHRLLLFRRRKTAPDIVPFHVDDRVGNSAITLKLALSSNSDIAANS